MHDAHSCQWCGAPLTYRRKGAVARFCRRSEVGTHSPCHRWFHRWRRWFQAAQRRKIWTGYGGSHPPWTLAALGAWADCLLDDLGGASVVPALAWSLHRDVRSALQAGDEEEAVRCVLAALQLGRLTGDRSLTASARGAASALLSPDADTLTLSRQVAQ